MESTKAPNERGSTNTPLSEISGNLWKSAAISKRQASESHEYQTKKHGKGNEQVHPIPLQEGSPGFTDAFFILKDDKLGESTTQNPWGLFEHFLEYNENQTIDSYSAPDSPSDSDNFLPIYVLLPLDDDEVYPIPLQEELPVFTDAFFVLKDDKLDESITQSP